MADRPFPLWPGPRPVAEDPAPAEPVDTSRAKGLFGPHLTFDLAEVNFLYRLLAGPPYNFPPPVVDEIELWMIAEMVGLNEDKGWLATMLPEPDTTTPEGQAEVAADLNAERVRRAREGLDDAEPPPSMVPTNMDAMMTAFRARKAAERAAEAATAGR